LKTLPNRSVKYGNLLNILDSLLNSAGLYTEKAITDAGLDAETIAILCGREQATEEVKNTDDDENTVTNTVGKVDPDGNPVYVKSLRYNELYALLVATLYQNIKDRDNVITDLSARLAKLEAKGDAITSAT
jgi:hypothetical protein